MGQDRAFEETNGETNRSRPQPAAKLTDRDRDLLGLLVLARYLTAAQVHRLVFPGKHASLPYRRLLQLSRPGGQPPFVRQRFFRTYDGIRMAVWAPTPYALPAALSRSAPLPELPKHDVGAYFLEHLLQLNELLIALWRIEGRCPRAAHPAFRWIPSDRVRLTWGEWEMRDGRKQQRVIQPDAVLELPSLGKRYFLECEMGTQLISPGQAGAPGATLSKADRYQTFLAETSGLDAQHTHYQAQYPDAFVPEVAFLVLNRGRAASVNKALAAWRSKLDGGKSASIRAMTFEDAAAEIRSLAGLPNTLSAGTTNNAASPPAPIDQAKMTPSEVQLLGRFLAESVSSIKRARAAFRALGRNDLPEYPATYEEAHTLLARLRAGDGAASR